MCLSYLSTFSLITETNGVDLGPWDGLKIFLA
jgi:hypothetical protein